ncbi:isochorismatase family protein [Paenibacillus physcomitrellae]|uniref:Isochorismatase family protein YwoC n=1 Tax=Paenibacillus physcomitrellae TaxID=1619311 RepID=A0ABQ1FSU6_9BACL|nr:isochorismatase family protein [Paenibacillus physcomitrellae]GGA26964.1 putative isochorismatase family protein YwoC [Paenibacillus physcomitrellae]
MNELNVDFSKTALVLIDLQKGIVQMSDGQEVVNQAEKLVKLFRKNNGFTAFVNVAFHDGKDMLQPFTDQPAAQAGGERPADFADFVPELEVGPADYVVTKRQWGAFFGTDLDLQLRRRGIDTIVLCGIATNIGVESTAREAFQHGYNQVFVTDAMKTFSQEQHDATVNYIFPRIGKIRTTEQFLAQVQA